MQETIPIKRSVHIRVENYFSFISISAILIQSHIGPLQRASFIENLCNLCTNYGVIQRMRGGTFDFYFILFWRHWHRETATTYNLYWRFNIKTDIDIQIFHYYDHNFSIYSSLKINQENTRTRFGFLIFHFVTMYSGAVF